MNALHVRHACASARIRQRAILAHGFLLEIRRTEIGERIAARVVVVGVASHVEACGEDRRRTDQMIPRGRDVERADLGALIRGANHVAVRIEAAIRHHDAVPRRGILRVERIGRLKPGTRVAHVQMQRIRCGQLIVHAVKDIFLVAFVVHHAELRRIEETAAVEPAHGDEVSPFFASVTEIEAASCRPKRAVRPGHASVRRRFAQARARGHVNYEARLVAVFGGRRAGNHFERLDRIERNLIREHLALLVGDRLAVHGKRILGVIAEAVEETVGIRGDAGRGKRDERADR